MKMLYYDRTDVSEGIHVIKTSASKDCDICHYWYFLNYCSVSAKCLQKMSWFFNDVCKP